MYVPARWECGIVFGFPFMCRRFEPGILNSASTSTPAELSAGLLASYATAHEMGMMPTLITAKGRLAHARVFNPNALLEKELGLWLQAPSVQWH